MDKEQPKQKQLDDKRRLENAERQTDNVFDTKSRVPNEQNAFKETQPRYGE